MGTTLDGKVALITGSGSVGGQGAAEARLFASEGARVVVTDLPTAAGAQVAAEIGERAEYQPLDVRDADAWARVVEHVVATYGKLDILVNNAGVWLAKSLIETTAAEYREVVEVNQDLGDAPERLNEDPYGDGWICVLSVADAGELDGLMDATAYRTLIDG